MQQTVDEGLRVINNIPLPVDCLIMSNRGNPGSWDNRRMHYHEYIEILYPLKGDFDVMLNGVAPEAAYEALKASVQELVDEG